MGDTVIEREYKVIKRKKVFTNDRYRISIYLLCLLLLVGISAGLFVFQHLPLFYNNDVYIPEVISPAIDIKDIPDYCGETYTVLNGNKPFFELMDSENGSFEVYSPLDSLGRCGTAYANLCKELMPTQEREEIGMIKPSGWHTVKYPGFIEELFLYNRCHLIAFSLAG